ncbi:MAG: hypothetical protein AMXMBFR23_11780 [Chloroflexota bacterium]
MRKFTALAIGIAAGIAVAVVVAAQERLQTPPSPGAHTEEG